MSNQPGGSFSAQYASDRAEAWNWGQNSIAKTQVDWPGQDHSLQGFLDGYGFQYEYVTPHDDATPKALIYSRDTKLPDQFPYGYLIVFRLKTRDEWILLRNLKDLTEVLNYLAIIVGRQQL